MTLLRYLGKQQRILALYQAFRETPDKGLHPIQLCRATGLDMFEVRARLDGCPELFVRLPRSADGVVRYRLTSATAALTDDDVEALVLGRARSEQLTVTAGAVILVSLLVLVLMTVIPATRMGLL
ncbi:MAG: hypothetical protein V2I63_01640 [Pseudomonadales bacterium]|nr:hypothetical protein [Pseudomonadales bacterium]